MFRAGWTAVLLLTLLAGCGGGEPISRVSGASDGGGNTPPTGVTTELISEESFLGGPLNTAKWTLLGGSRGRSDFFNLFSFSDGKVTLNLDTYNQQNFFSKVSGSGIESLNAFSAAGGIAVQARLRLGSDAAGVVAEMGLRGENGLGSYDSISAAYLGNQTLSFLLLQHWKNEPATPNYGAADRLWTLKSRGGFSRRNWHVLEIRYRHPNAQWYLDGTLLHESALSFAAAIPMKVWLRIWAPETDWPQGYSTALSPAVNPYAAVRYPLEVDWVRIYRIIP